MLASVVGTTVRPRLVAAVAVVLLGCSSGGSANVKATNDGTLPGAVQETFATWAHDNTDARGSLTVDYVQTTVDGPAQYASAFGVGTTPVYLLFVKGSFNDLHPYCRGGPRNAQLPTESSSGSDAYTAVAVPSEVATCAHPPGNLMAAIDPAGNYCDCRVSDPNYIPDLSADGTALTTTVNVGT